MNAEDIPATWRKMIDDAAGREHGTDGAVLSTLALILTAHENALKSVQEDEPVFMLRGSDPSAPFALLAYASASQRAGASVEFVASIKREAMRFYSWQDTHGVIELGKSMMINDKIDRMFQGTTHRRDDA